MKTKETLENVTEVVSILKKFPRGEEKEALKAVGKFFGVKDLTKEQLQKYLRNNHNIRAYASLFKDSQEEMNTESKYKKFEGLVKVTRRGPVTFEDVCNKLGLTPAKTKELILEAQNQGIKIKVNGLHVGLEVGGKGWKEPHHRGNVTQIDTLPTEEIAEISGGVHRIAVISDTHLGSKYCLRKQLQDFIHYAYSKGVREILHPGDVLDGCYRHSAFELSHVGLDDQTRDLFETLPQLPGLKYRMIMGNHDFTFTEKIGVDVGEYIKNYFNARGRKDIEVYGNRSAFLDVEGCVFHLWHPARNAGFTKSYQLQKQVERYTSLKPQVLLVGHWHIYCEVYERGVHAIACPTFQGGGSAFGKSLGGSPAIGGLLISWEATTNKAIRNLCVEKRFYYEVEELVKVRNNLDAIPIEG